MSVLILMIPMALLLAGGFIYAFFWAVSAGQFDDLTTPQHRLLAKDSENKKLQNFNIKKNNHLKSQSKETEYE